MIVTLFWLLVGHSLCDYPLQGEYLAAAKRMNSGHSTPWWIALTAHSLIHAGMVFLVTGNFAFGLLELAAHWLIDFLKCNGAFDGSPPIPYEMKPNQDWTPTPAQLRRAFTLDQALHVGCKVLWAAF